MQRRTGHGITLTPVPMVLLLRAFSLQLYFLILALGYPQAAHLRYTLKVGWEHDENENIVTRASVNCTWKKIAMPGSYLAFCRLYDRLPQRGHNPWERPLRLPKEVVPLVMVSHSEM